MLIVFVFMGQTFVYMAELDLQIVLQFSSDLLDIRVIDVIQSTFDTLLEHLFTRESAVVCLQSSLLITLIQAVLLSELGPPAEEGLSSDFCTVELGLLFFLTLLQLLVVLFLLQGQLFQEVVLGFLLDGGYQRETHLHTGEHVRLDLLFQFRDQRTAHVVSNGDSVGDIPVSYTHLTLPTTPYV